MKRSPLAGVDANLLVALDALLTDENVGAAARRVGLSESAMSHALARARDLFGDPLLVRVGRRMAATERARRMAPALREGIARLATVTDSPSPIDPRAMRRTVKIAATDFGHGIVGAPLVELLSREAPGVDLVFLPFSVGSFGLLATGDVDLALSKVGQGAGLRTHLLVEEPFVCVARRGHPILRARATAKRFASYGHVLISPGGRVKGAVDKALARRGLERRVAYVSPTFLVAAQVVARTDFLLTCSERSARMARDWLDLATFAPPVPVPPFPQAMVWHARTEHDRFLGWLRERIVEVAAAT